MLWSWPFLFEQVLPRLLQAVPTTIAATVLGFAVALVLGLVFALLRMSRSEWIRVPVTEAVEFIRGTPILVQLYFLFFILPDVGIMLPPFTTGIIALGLHYAAYCAEVYRSGLENIPRGQWEAARALNLSRYVTFRYVVIPQAIPPIVPVLGNNVIAMFKETPILAFVAVGEMMQEVRIIGSETFRYTEPVTLAGLFFLGLSLAASGVIRLVERLLKNRAAGR